jgi:hypothetical protein
VQPRRPIAASSASRSRRPGHGQASARCVKAARRAPIAEAAFAAAARATTAREVPRAACARRPQADALAALPGDAWDQPACARDRRAVVDAGELNSASCPVYASTPR